MDNPKDLKYTKEHEWVKIDGGVATIGITDFAQAELTDIVFVELPEKGKHATAGKEMAVVESVKSVSDIFAPVSGEIIEVNDKLLDNPELLNKEPYDSGWIVKIKIDGEVEGAMSAEEYEKLVG